MHREGGVIEATKFSLAGNAKAPAASPKKQGAVLVWNRGSDVIGGFFLGKLAVASIFGVSVFGGATFP